MASILKHPSISAFVVKMMFIGRVIQCSGHDGRGVFVGNLRQRKLRLAENTEPLHKGRVHQNGIS